MVFPHSDFKTGIESYKGRVLAAGLTDDHWRQFLAYTAAVFNNCGNYRSFGDSKFVPELDKAMFRKVVEASERYEENKEQIDFILNHIEKEVFTEEPPLA